MSKLKEKIFDQVAAARTGAATIEETTKNILSLIPNLGNSGDDALLSFEMLPEEVKSKLSLDDKHIYVKGYQDAIIYFWLKHEKE